MHDGGRRTLLMARSERAWRRLRTAPRSGDLSRDGTPKCRVLVRGMTRACSGGAEVARDFLTYERPPGNVEARCAATVGGPVALADLWLTLLIRGPVLANDLV